MCVCVVFVYHVGYNATTTQHMMRIVLEVGVEWGVTIYKFDRALATGKDNQNKTHKWEYHLKIS